MWSRAPSTSTSWRRAAPTLAKVAPSICVDNIDRAAFHKTFNAAVVRFFEDVKTQKKIFFFFFFFFFKKKKKKKKKKLR